MKKYTKAEMTRAMRFNEAVESFIVSHGGIVLGKSIGSFELTQCGADHSIQTIAGELRITPHGTWIACRFEDIEAAKTILPFWPKRIEARLNGFSGKWNFTNTQDRTFNGGDSLEALKRELVPLLPK